MFGYEHDPICFLAQKSPLQCLSRCTTTDWLSLPGLYFRLTRNLSPTIVSLFGAVVTAATVVDLSVPHADLPCSTDSFLLQWLLP